MLVLFLIVWQGQAVAAPAASGSDERAEEAYEAFLKSSSLHGASAPEDLLQALTRFTQQWPNHAGAMLDLALLHCEMGDKNAMEALFLRMEERFALPPGIRQFMTVQRQRSCVYSTGPSFNQGAWSWEASLGHSSNANLATGSRQILFAADAPIASLNLDEQSRRQPDNFLSLAASGHGGLQGSTQWHLGVSHKAHQDNPWLNQWGLQLGLWWRWVENADGSASSSYAGPFQPTGGMGLSTGQWWVNGRHQESSLRLRLDHWFKPFPNQDLGQLGLTTGLQHQRFSQDPMFDSQKVEVGLRWFLSLARGEWVYLGFDRFLDRPINSRPGGPRQGSTAYVSLGQPNAWGELSLTGIVQLQRDFDPYNPSFFGQATRSQHRGQIRLQQVFRGRSTSSPFSKGVGVHFFTEVSLDKADDTLPFFSFSAVSLRVGLKSGFQ